MKAGLTFTEKEEHVESRNTKVSVERTISQIRNLA